MSDYFHSALRGEQIHEAKIKVLPEGSSFPIPDWEGQFLVIGLKLYVSIAQNNVLTWMQPKAYNLPQLPPNVVVFERGFTAPAPRNEDQSGIIYTNINTDENYYLSLGKWIKLGGGSNAAPNQLLIQNSSFNDLVVPTDGTTNAALLKNWEPNKEYYFKFEAPPSTTLSAQATPGYFPEIRYYDYLNPIILQNDLISLYTANLQDLTAVYKIMIYFNNIYGERVYCNFKLDLESRLIKVENIATIYYF